MKRQRGFVWAAAIVVTVAVAGYIYQTRDEGGKEDNAPMAMRGRGSGPLHVNVEVLRHQMLTDEIRVTGLLIPDEEVNLSFETSGKITDIYFKEGTKVRQGELLAKVNDAQLQAQLRKLEAQVPLAEDRVYRQNALLQRDAVSKEALEQVKTELAMLRAEIDMVKAQIEFTELRAPFDGVVGLRQVSVGTYASPSTIVARLTKLTPLKVEFSVPERYSGEVRTGSPLRFTVDGQLNPYSAKVYACESAVDKETHSLVVRALYANAGGELMPGRYASITLTKETIDGALAIPSEAIVPEMGKDKVFVCRSGKAQPVEIKTGLRTEARVQVLEGLNEGDTLIVSGTMQLRTGMEVKYD